MKLSIQYSVFSILLILGLVVRLYKIDNPIADWHSWRQADTSAVTRNFLKSGINVLYPKGDDLSDVSGNGANIEGYRFVEFPIFNLLHYSTAKFLPQKTLEYAGRLTTALISLMSATLLFTIVSKKIDDWTGLVAAGVFLFLPYNIFYSRVVLPDPLAVMFTLAALVAFEYRKRFLVIVFGALAVLTKPTAIFFLLPIVSEIWLYVPILIPFVAWRWWENQFPVGIPANTWLLNGNGIRFKGAFFRWIFGERIGSIILGKWGLIPLGLGVLNSQKFGLWIIGALLYLFTFATGNVQHDYYQIPIIPVISILVALGVVYMWQTWRGKILVVASLLLSVALSWYEVRGWYQINNWSIVRAGQAVDRLTPRDAVVIAPYNGDTAFLYQTNRKGLPMISSSIQHMKQQFNISYYVSVNYDDDTNRLMKQYKVIEKTPEYVIIKL